MVFHGRLRARNLAQRARLLHGPADERHRRGGHRIPQLVVQPVRVPLPLPLQHKVLRKALRSTGANHRNRVRHTAQAEQPACSREWRRTWSRATSRGVKKRGGWLSMGSVPAATALLSSSSATNSQKVECAFL